MDQIHGPCVFEVRPNERELQHDELKDLARAAPQYDWEAAIAERAAEARRITPTPDE